MGEAILLLAMRSTEFRVVAAIVRPGSAWLGKPLRDMLGTAAGAIGYSTSLGDADAPAVLIDFSSAQAFDDALAIARARRIAFISGTTGLSERQHAAMRESSATIPILWSANFSIGVAVLERLVGDASRMLRDWDCEIAEAHHRYKKDAPSGTALALGRAVAEARGDDFERVADRDRASATTPRDPSAIGFASMRGGDIVGDHMVMFAGDGERIELVHRATDREIFARGALRAALGSDGVGGHLLDGRPARMGEVLIACRQASSLAIASAGFRDLFAIEKLFPAETLPGRGGQSRAVVAFSP